MKTKLTLMCALALVLLTGCVSNGGGFGHGHGFGHGGGHFAHNWR